MPKKILLFSNLIICMIITVGFIITSVISYRSNLGVYKRDIEHVTKLTADSIFYQMETAVSKPIHVSLTMANDSLLRDYLEQEDTSIADEAYISKIQEYLNTYKQKYGYETVFLISSASERYYHFDGVTRNLTPDLSENAWYYEFLETDDEYFINVDNDIDDANDITIFINCKIRSPEDGSVKGVVGIGFAIQDLQSMMSHYDEQFGVKTTLVDWDGNVQLPYKQENKLNLLKQPLYQDLKDVFQKDTKEMQTIWKEAASTEVFIVTQYLSNMKWHLVIEKDTTDIQQRFQEQLGQGIGVIAAIIILVLLIITRIIRTYNAKIVRLTVSQELEYNNLLMDSAEAFYESVLEINVSANQLIGSGAHDYLEKIGLPDQTTYDEMISYVAKNQIKEEFKEEYVTYFSRENILEAYQNGITNRTLDMLMKKEEDTYQWIRVTIRLFYWQSDQSLHMISYRQNIDVEKRKELELIERTQRDALTGLLNKRTAEEMITEELKMPGVYALLILDIDNFKSINDEYGHQFGDEVIRDFAVEVKNNFQNLDILGRIGGDEFVVLMTHYGEVDIIRKKMERLCQRLEGKVVGGCKDFRLTSSIGIALSPEHGSVYRELYEKADQALYYSKGHGKNTFSIYGEELSESASVHVSQRDLEKLIGQTTDGVVKIACMEQYKILYFNEAYLELTGYTKKELSALAMDAKSMIYGEDREQIIQVMEEAGREGNPFEVVYTLKRKDGKLVQVLFKGVFVSERYENEYPIFYGVYQKLV